jgi:hypothetical protein
VAKNATSGTIRWSSNTTAHPQNQSVSLPTALQKPSSNIWLIWGEVSYPYTPSMGYVVTGTINMYQDMFFYPRQSSCVTYNNVCS